MRANIDKLIFLGLVLATGCAAEPAPEATSTDEVVGGTPADSRIYDAVGALVTVADDGTVEPFCTAWLVSPRVAVTAKHCLITTPREREIFFAVGPDGTDPRRLYAVDGRVWERTIEGGIMGLGSDTAAVHLARSVRGIIPMLPVPMPQQLVGQSFEIIGYGRQDPFDVNADFGVRLRGQVRLEAVGPSPYYPEIYEGDFASFLQDFAEGDPALEPAAQLTWASSTLLQDYEGLTQRTQSITAGGDSGGPLVKRIGPFAAGFGVTSGIAFLSGPNADRVVENYSVYGLLGPEAMHMIRSADVCGGVPEEGVCNGDVVERCSGRSEGRIRVISEDCAAQSGTCARTPQGARCLPSCVTDADCSDSSGSANGVCDAGQCTWSEVDICTGEPGALACLLCCLGQGTGGDFEDIDFAICGGACFSFPASPQASTLSIQFTGHATLPTISLP